MERQYVCYCQCVTTGSIWMERQYVCYCECVTVMGLQAVYGWSASTCVIVSV